jgi:hypothetical protein
MTRHPARRAEHAAWKKIMNMLALGGLDGGCCHNGSHPATLTAVASLTLHPRTRHDHASRNPYPF